MENNTPREGIVINHKVKLGKFPNRGGGGQGKIKKPHKENFEVDTQS